MTEKTLTTENIKPALDALRGELAPWPVVAKKQDRLNTAQLNAANSGITSSLVAQIIANTAAIRALESAITGTGLRALVVASLPAVGTTGILYIVPVTTYDPDTDADVVNYSNEYIWIPVEGGTASEGHYEQVGQTGIVINNGQLTITVNGTSVGTFTANQSGDTTAAITVPTNADYVDRTTDQTVAGVKTFSSTINGTASKAIADEDGTSIKTGYGKLAGANVWSGYNTFTNYITSQESAAIPAGGYGKGIAFRDYQNNRFGYIQPYLTSDSEKRLLIGVDSGDIASNSNIIPNANNAVNLGSSSYQWSSVYAQSYYYNGTAWGLDQANVWTATQTIEQSTFAQLRLRNSTIKLGDAIPSAQKTVGAVVFVGSDNSNMGFMDFRESTLGNTFIRILARQKYDANGDRSTSGTIYESGLDICVLNDKTPCVVPTSNAKAQLGTSASKWKTLNGVNPGALSLPDYNSTAKVDISGSIIPDQYGNISYTPPINGWLYVCFNISNATTTDPIFYIQAKDNNVANSSFVQTSWMPTSGTSSLSIFFPVVANKRFVIQINFSNYTIIKAHVIPCLGNV